MYWALWKVPGLGKRIKSAKLFCHIFKPSCATNMFVPWLFLFSRQQEALQNGVRWVVDRQKVWRPSCYFFVNCPSSPWQHFQWHVLERCSSKSSSFDKRPKIIEKYNFFKRHDQALSELLLNPRRRCILSGQCICSIFQIERKTNFYFLWHLEQTQTFSSVF